ncbi:MAG: UDP-glucose/GDP-mannose dehydrogenase family protein [Burkholderiales bacterium]|nr:MAG: UDP-glucose/GDP-mannose dehydrogenase family protein [Burkholderiales bacterium]
MKLTIIGTGYVGLVTGACLPDVGNHDCCLDLDQAKIARLERGEIPIYEPGLEGVVAHNVRAGRLRFTTDVAESVGHGTVQMIAVGTPPSEDGSADLSHVLAAARNIALHMDGYRLVVTKSTVPVGSCERVYREIARVLAERGAELPYDCASNPEFLKEGAAVDDFQKPDRIIVGIHAAAQRDRALDLLRDLYAPFQRNHERLLVMDAASSELSKYAANAMLASRISFMNDLARLAEAVGADIEKVRVGIGSDPRIGSQFLYPGAGYGGSCFPKDVRALLRSGDERDIELDMVAATERVNERQKHLLAHRVIERFGEDLAGRSFAIWGVAFKPSTDDVREAPSLVTAERLVRAGALLRVFDPVAMPNFVARLAELGLEHAVTACESAYDTLDGADALLIHTEWKEFRSPDFEAICARLERPLILDGRNLYDPRRLAAMGIDYVPIGRSPEATGRDLG